MLSCTAYSPSSPIFTHALTRARRPRHERNARALWLRSRFQIPIVATNDVHTTGPGRQRLQDALTAIREATPLQKLGHKLFSQWRAPPQEPGTDGGALP